MSQLCNGLAGMGKLPVLAVVDNSSMVIVALALLV